MPVDMPDARIHKHCVKCGQWFEPEEGEKTSIRFGGPLSQLRKVGDRFIGLDRNQRFMCYPCIERQAKQKKILGIALVIFVLLLSIAFSVVVLYYFNGLQGKVL